MGVAETAGTDESTIKKTPLEVFSGVFDCEESLRSFELVDYFIHLQACARLGGDLLYLDVVLDLENVFHLHGFDDDEFFACLDFLAFGHRNLA